MATDNNLKSSDFADKLGLRDQITVDAKSGVAELPETYYADSLEKAGVGVTLDQLKKLQKHDASLLAATTLVVGEKAASLYKENPELSEVSFSYSMGHNKAHGYFQRDNEQAPVRNVVEIHGAQDRGELNKVYKHVKGLFDNINS